MREHAFAQSEDFRELISAQPMLSVITHVRLEHNMFLTAGHSSAINIVFCHVTNFRHVRMLGNMIAIRQDKAGECRWILFDDSAQFIQFHTRIYTASGIYSSVYLTRARVEANAAAARSRSLTRN